MLRLSLLAAAALVPAAWPRDVQPAPEFAGITAWINSKPLTMAGLRGRVVVVHFWTHGCINCIHNYPALKRWQAKYADRGVTIVGVHTPEFASEKNLKRIEAKAKQHGLTYAIAVDNDAKTWAAWHNRSWPCVYLVDKRGQVRYYWEGELNSQGAHGEAIMGRHIDELLKEPE